MIVPKFEVFATTSSLRGAVGRLIVLGLDMAQSSSDRSNSLIYDPSLSSSQIASTSCNIVGSSTQQLKSSPEDTTCNGFEIEESDPGQFRIISFIVLPGSVLAVSPFLDRYVLASAGNILNVFDFADENTRKLRKLAVGTTRFAITCVTTHFSRIAVADSRDGILFFSYHEDIRKLKLLYSDPAKRLVADCALLDLNTAVVSDRRGNISILSCTNLLEGNKSPERNLSVNWSFYIGEIVMRIRKGLLPYKLPILDTRDGSGGVEFIVQSAYRSIVACTMLGSVFIIIPIKRLRIRLQIYIEIGKRERVRLREMQRIKKQKIQEILDEQNATIDGDMNNKGKGRLKYLLQQTEIFSHFAKGRQVAKEKKPKGSEQYELLGAVQARLALHPLTSPILGNSHKEFRGRGSKGAPTIIDGDMVAQFLELSIEQQEDVLASSSLPNNETPMPRGPVISILEHLRNTIN